MSSSLTLALSVRVAGEVESRLEWVGTGYEVGEDGLSRRLECA